MTPEGRIKAKLKRELDKLPNVYQFRPVQNGMGAPGLDVFLCVNRFFVAIETKAPGKKPTARQEVTMKAITDAGGDAIVVDDDRTLYRCIEWIKYLLTL